MSATNPGQEAPDLMRSLRKQRLAGLERSILSCASAVISSIRSVDENVFARTRGQGPKVFVVGRNKTGTTSIRLSLASMGYRVGRQAAAELLYHKYYFEGNFDPIIAYCRKAEAFQDVPFSAPFTFAVLDRAFPRSRFILTVRESPEEWYSSLVRFHARKFGQDGRPPTAAQLRAADYRTPGFMANLMRLYGTRDNDPYEKAPLLAAYERHNAAVRAHFVDRSSQLLEINVASVDALERLETFLGRATGFDRMPHANRTDSPGSDGGS